jgi:hypothetical protein
MVKLLRSRFAQIVCWALVFVVEFLTLRYSRQLGLSWAATIINLNGATFALIALCFLLPDTVMRRRWRFKSVLVENEVPVRGATKGQHGSELRKLAKQSTFERWCVHYPWRIAEVTTVILALYAWWCLAGSPHGGIHGSSSLLVSWLVYMATTLRAAGYWLLGLIPGWRYITAGYLPLMLAPPVILELVTRWLEKLYVLVEDRKGGTARLLFVNGIFSGDAEGMMLSNTVSMKVRKPKFIDWLINRGSIEFHEKGGPGDQIENIFAPSTFYRRIQTSINRLHH